jgi:hypothetical protein
MGDLKVGWRRPIGEDGLMDIVALDDAGAVDAAGLVPVDGDLHPAPGGVLEWLKIWSVSGAAPEAAVCVEDTRNGAGGAGDGICEAGSKEVCDGIVNPWSWRRKMLVACHMHRIASCHPTFILENGSLECKPQTSSNK